MDTVDVVETANEGEQQQQQTPQRAGSRRRRKSSLEEDDVINQNNNNIVEDEDNDSFVTMEEIKTTTDEVDDSDNDNEEENYNDSENDILSEEDNDLLAKLEYGRLSIHSKGMLPDARIVSDDNEHDDNDIDERNSVIEETNTATTKNKKANGLYQRTSFRQRLSHQFYSSSASPREIIRRSSSIIMEEAIPKTPAGWTVLVSTLASMVLGYELHLQKTLSCPPIVFGQCCTSINGGNRGNGVDNGNENETNKNFPLQAIYNKLTETTESIMSRPIEPSLFVGTRGTVASTAAYALAGPSAKAEHVAFRQVLTMSTDGAKIVLDWELPPTPSESSRQQQQQQQQQPSHSYFDDAKAREQRVKMKGGIDKPLVLILHGMNNDSSFGYIKSLMRTFTDRGWISVAMNFRGMLVPLATPRCYNGGYTGDLRGVVTYLESRLAKDVPLFLVGNSLSANIVTKYLGEEGFSGTLPRCVAGGVSLGNPLLMHANNLSSPWKEILALGVKKDLLLNWPSFRHMMTVPSFRSAIYNTLRAPDIGRVDAALAPIFIRNESHYPFAVRIGFKDAEDYWSDSSSFKYIKHISVPCLQIVASDDIICYKSFQKKLCHCIQNPYVMCVETKCGGHLGWQESPPESNAFGIGTSWADRATADFFGAILDTGTFQYKPPKRSVSSRSSSQSLNSEKLPEGQHSLQGNSDTLKFRSKL